MVMQFLGHLVTWSPGHSQMNFGFGELVVIFGIILLLFGARRLPEIGRSLGEAIKQFQDSVKGTSKDRDKDHTEQKS